MVRARNRQFCLSEPVPELPEVETVRRGLAPHLVGAQIYRVDARRPDLRFPLPAGFVARLEGQTIVGLERRAKYLVATLSSGELLVMHLGMTGRFSVLSGRDDSDTTELLGEYVYPSGTDPKHDHVVLHLNGGTRIVYNDPRRFGFMLMMADGERETHALFKNLGAEPLGAGLTADYLARRSHGRKVNLKSFLMDQRNVAGLGNIYVSEALYRAQLSPDRAARFLSDKRGQATERAHALVHAIRDVLSDAIVAGGSTLKDYRHADGEKGAFQDNFSVYDREGMKCLRRGCHGIIRRTVHTGRATFSCPACQR
jgi:formamidopyrimidine-DNA glycosylase